ncbi:MAG: DUF3127 domain-containing protein [Rikenellaceae bacterium]
MEFEGTIFKILPATSGTSARGPWHRQDVVFETVDGTYTRKICVTFFNKQSEVEALREGQSYKVSFNLESREYNGKWYSDIRAWRVQQGGAATSEPSSYSEAPAATAAQTPPPYSAPIPSEPTYAASSSAEDVDDLPF